MRLVEQLASLEVPTPPLPDPMSPSQAAELVGEISQAVERHTRDDRARADRARLARAALAQAGLLLAEQPRPRRAAHGAPTAISPRRSAAIRTSSATGRCCPRSARTSTRREPRSSASSASGPPNASARRPTIERDADDIARCFLLERLLRREGAELAFAGEVVGLISAGAFVAFSAAQPPARAAVRGDAAGAGAGGRRRPPAGAAGTGSRGGRRQRPGAPGRGAGSRGPGREWWELNEEGTILHGERSGVEHPPRPADRACAWSAWSAIRGRVDLAPAG